MIGQLPLQLSDLPPSWAPPPPPRLLQRLYLPTPSTKPLLMRKPLLPEKQKMRILPWQSLTRWSAITSRVRPFDVLKCTGLDLTLTTLQSITSHSPNPERLVELSPHHCFRRRTKKSYPTAVRTRITFTMSFTSLLKILTTSMSLWHVKLEASQPCSFPPFHALGLWSLCQLTGKPV